MFVEFVCNIPEVGYSFLIKMEAQKRGTKKTFHFLYSFTTDFLMKVKLGSWVWIF